MDQDVMDLTNSLGEAVDGHDFDTVMNSLVYMLAHGGYNSGLDKEVFIKLATTQLSDLYDLIKMDNDASTSITSN